MYARALVEQLMEMNVVGIICTLNHLCYKINRASVSFLKAAKKTAGNCYLEMNATISTRDMETFCFIIINSLSFVCLLYLFLVIAVEVIKRSRECSWNNCT